MPKINLTLPDGKSKSYDKGITGLEVAKSIGPRLAKDAVAIEINGKLSDINEKIDENAKIKIITFNDKLGLDVLRHSLAHLLAAAVMELYPGTKRTIGKKEVNMGFENTLGLIALASLIPFIILYLRKPKPQDRIIPSLMFILKNKKTFIHYVQAHPLCILN